MFEPSSKDWAGKTGDSGASPLRVLLAEDTPINAEMMRAMAEHLKIDMDVAANGLETIAMIEAAKISFAERGVREDRLFYDSFEFGLDVPVRILARPH